MKTLLKSAVLLLGMGLLSTHSQAQKVVDKIQFTETNADDRPVKNIKIKSMKIVNK